MMLAIWLAVGALRMLAVLADAARPAALANSGPGSGLRSVPPAMYHVGRPSLFMSRGVVTDCHRHRPGTSRSEGER